LGSSGQLGNNVPSFFTEAVQVDGSMSFEQLAIGFFHSCGIDNAGAGFCWGRGAQLGHGGPSTKTQLEPTAIHGGHEWKQIAVLRVFVKRGFFEEYEAQAMLQWPHSGFHVYDEVLVPEYNTAFALRLARYCARNPVALERMKYHTTGSRVKYRSDKTEGPSAGSETVGPLGFLARLVTHIPDKHQVMTRYCGWYSNRTRGERERLGSEDGEPPPIAERERLTLRESRLRWAELLRRIFEVDPLRCPACSGEMRQDETGHSASVSSWNSMIGPRGSGDRSAARMNLAFG
jgi:hypothetical protein